MPEKRFTTMWIPESTFSRFWIARDNGKQMNANDVVELLNELHEENQRLKAQISANSEEGVCSICKYCYLVKHQDMQGYYVAKCEKGHKECSKEAVRYCEDFELMVK